LVTDLTMFLETAALSILPTVYPQSVDFSFGCPLPACFTFSAVSFGRVPRLLHNLDCVRGGSDTWESSFNSGSQHRPAPLKRRRDQAIRTGCYVAAAVVSRYRVSRYNRLSLMSIKPAFQNLFTLQRCPHSEAGTPSSVSGYL
jgi:hypothetical protein